MHTSTTLDAIAVDERLSLLPVRDCDRDFLRTLYTDRRQAELNFLPWNHEQKQAFCDMQQNLQERHYASAYPNAVNLLICAQATPVGRISYCRLGTTEIRLIDICLLSAYRATGLGSAVLQWLQHYAHHSDAEVTLHVAEGNPAQQLYRRLGFKEEGRHGLDYFMIWPR